MSLNGKVALVTGSGRNIGRATALELARRGADVAVNARTNRAEAESVASEARDLGVRAVAIVSDVADAVQVERMVSEAAAQLGPIDILVNNAGLRKVASIGEISVEEWREVVGVNMDGPFFTCKAVVPGMIDASACRKGWGRIINVSGLKRLQRPSRLGPRVRLEDGSAGADASPRGRASAARDSREPHRARGVRHYGRRRSGAAARRSASRWDSVGTPRPAGRGSACVRIPGVGRSKLHHGADDTRQRRCAGRVTARRTLGHI